MIDYKEFENKIKSMSAYDIIMAMVEGLRNPRTRIDMDTFGLMIEGICFGCAATNAILHIMDANEEEVKSHVLYIKSDDCSRAVYFFERAINLLRMGRLESYNAYVKDLGFAQITPIPGQYLPDLDNDYTEEQLQEYVKLAEYQLTV